MTNGCIMHQYDINEIRWLHKLWLNGDPEGVRANLNFADMKYANLENADLRKAIITNSDLRWSNIKHVNFREADLNGTDFSYAKASFANFDKADICNARFDCCNLISAYFSKIPTSLTISQFNYEVEKVGNNTNINTSKEDVKKIFIKGMKLSYDYMTHETANISDYYDYIYSEIGYSARLFSRSWYEAMRFHPAIDQERISNQQEVYLFFKKKNLVVNKEIRDFLVYDGFYFANYLLYSGIKNYSDFKGKMTNKFGEKISPFIRSFYEYLRFYPGIDSSGMTRSDEIDRYYFEKLGE